MQDLELEAWLDRAVELEEQLKEARRFTKATIDVMGVLVHDYLELRGKHKTLINKYGLLLKARYEDKVRHGEVKNGKPMRVLA